MDWIAIADFSIYSESKEYFHIYKFPLLYFSIFERII